MRLEKAQALVDRLTLEVADLTLANATNEALVAKLTAEMAAKETAITKMTQQKDIDAARLQISDMFTRKTDAVVAGLNGGPALTALTV
jgi:predicted DNA-binding protein (UPF0251 family)